jgi:1,2-diacylglycerol 3-alpha-glucosyltransferase
MKIGLFADCYPPTVSGVVTSLLQLRQGLVQRGHKVVVFTVATPGHSQGDGTGQTGVRCFPSLPFNRASDFRLGLVNPRAVQRMVREERLDVIHTHTEYSLGWAGQGAARRLGLAHVHTAHTLHEAYRHYLPFGRALPPRLVQSYLRLFLSHCDALVCPSGKARDYFQTFLPGGPGPPGLNIVVISNGVSRSHFQPQPPTEEQQAATRQALGLRPSDQVILYAGRIAREKRVVELLDALAPLLHARPQAKVLFVGSGPADRELAAAVGRNRVGSQVVLAGRVAWGQMHRFYALARLFVTASLSEMQPMTLIEACLCGLPIVARRDPAYTGLVRNGYNGYLVDSDRLLAEWVLELLDDETRLLRFSRNAVRVADEFSAEKHVERMECLYQQVVKKRAVVRMEQSAAQ